MEGVKSQKIDATTARVMSLAKRDGKAAGKAFVKDWNLGSNSLIDKLFREGIESNASIIIQRLPWAKVLPDLLDDPNALAKKEAVAREVADELIWIYMVQYDASSRAVILDTITHNTDGKDTI